MEAAGMSIVEIAKVASRYDTLMARRTHEACVRAAIERGGKSMKKLQREFSHLGRNAADAAEKAGGAA